MRISYGTIRRLYRHACPLHTDIKKRVKFVVDAIDESIDAIVDAIDRYLDCLESSELDSDETKEALLIRRIVDGYPDLYE